MYVIRKHLYMTYNFTQVENMLSKQHLLKGFYREKFDTIIELSFTDLLIISTVILLFFPTKYHSTVTHDTSLLEFFRSRTIYTYQCL